MVLGLNPVVLDLDPVVLGLDPEVLDLDLDPHCPLLMSGPGPKGSKSRPSLSIIDIQRCIKDIWAWVLRFWA